MDTVTDLPIPAEAIDAAAKGMHAHDWRNTTKTWDDRSVKNPTKISAVVAAERPAYRAKARAAFDALGMEAERQAAQEGMEEAPARERLVSRWFSVKP